ncbi:MAG: hypothetical protein WCI64_00900 [Chlorobium sp.]
MKVGNRAILRKIEKILPELEEHPATGTGGYLVSAKGHYNDK